ncbi:hypothetical protein DPMN_020460 [Dreissena polymorpha]|uniref:Uncharacterized protein n=1 Tax=Dreissena polymorpha TaxID=45954 RepID=A0A9D4NIW5_DREPO|nr:hypothetical protein DPMN_020460 [Dreissena polymorpha]
MKATLAGLELALFAVLAECKLAEKPAQNLRRERILEKLAEHAQASTCSYYRLQQAALEEVGLCNKVFEHVEAMLRKEEDEEVDAAEDDDKRVAKTLLNHFSTPCTSIIQTELDNSN